MTPVVHLVGYSNSGKTTLMAGLIRVFKGRNYDVAAVKHAAHGYTADPPGADSWQYAQAGADHVAIVGPDSYTIHEFGKPDFPLADILAQFNQADLILVEGFKNAPGPKIEVYRQGISEDRMPWLHPRLAVVSDVPLHEENCFSFDELENLADFIAANLM
ncbi:MAG: molybdopterin-guanine dinucleotide biosynthesis protein B [Syntrophomonadaceae bacterium]